MKVAEALQLRADLNRRIAQLGERLNANALVQEGESTPEDPKALLREFPDQRGQPGGLPGQPHGDQDPSGGGRQGPAEAAGRPVPGLPGDRQRHPGPQLEHGAAGINT